MKVLPPGRVFAGIEPLLDAYDGFILDLWGVLHDGCRACPGAIPALERLREAGRKTVLVSNAPRRNDVVAEKLDGMGIHRGLYTGIVTSGEATWEALGRLYRGSRIFFVGQPDKDASIYTGNGVTLAESPEEADVLLVSGVRDFADGPEIYDDILRRARERDLPFVCANPDRIVHVGARMVVCAGTLADRYAALGGRVSWYGKPYPAVYERAFDILGGVDSRRVLAVGDSIVTDIAGAAGAGIDGLLIAGGIHRDELMSGEGLALEKLGLFDESVPFRPMGYMPRFCL